MFTELINSVTSREFNDRLDEVTSGPVAKLLLGALGAILFAMSAWTLAEVTGHSNILASVVTNQEYTRDRLKELTEDVRDIKKEEATQRDVITSLTQRFNDYLPVGRPHE